MKLSNIADSLGLETIGDDTEISHLGLCNRNDLDCNLLSYITSSKFFKQIVNKKEIVCLVVSRNLYNEIGDLKHDCSYIISDYPEDTFYKIHKFLCEQSNNLPPTVIGENCEIHPTSIIEDGVSVGNFVKIGAFSIIHAGTTIGDNCTICSHSIIGSNGFQALQDKNGHSYNVPHAGGVTIGQNCYIGEFVNVAKSLFSGNVEIGNNVLIDAHCQIAHNCKIGDNSRIAAGCILFGSSILKRNIWMSPGAMVMNKVIVADNTHVCPNSFIMEDTEQGEKYIGTPAEKFMNFAKTQYKISKILKYGK